MGEAERECQHACKNTCATLNEALRKETAMVKFSATASVILPKEYLSPADISIRDNFRDEPENSSDHIS